MVIVFLLLYQFYVCKVPIRSNIWFHVSLSYTSLYTISLNEVKEFIDSFQRFGGMQYGQLTALSGRSYFSGNFTRFVISNLRSVYANIQGSLTIALKI